MDLARNKKDILNNEQIGENENWNLKYTAIQEPNMTTLIWIIVAVSVQDLTVK